MKIYLLINPHYTKSYDEFDSAVVVAPNVREARRIHPAGADLHPYNPHTGKFDSSSDSWPSDPNDVEVECIGDANSSTKIGLICASFHAG